MKVRSTVAISLAGLALAAAQAVAATAGPTAIHARLSAMQEVPRQKVAVPQASGRLIGTLRKTAKGYRLTWRLTFTHVSGRVSSAYIHKGKHGKFGPALFHLCSPCSSGAHGSAYASPWEVGLMRTGRTYVNVRTQKNPAGEIRGQITLK